jgi:hypothetical protein
VEYFVALVSHGRGYQAFLLDSSRAFHGAGERQLALIVAGDTTPCFIGPEDTVLQRHGKKVSEEFDLMAFPTDAVTISAACEGHYKEIQSWAYIFVEDTFFSFSTAD